MRKIICITILAWSFALAHAQNNFNGTIEYSNLDLLKVDPNDTLFKKVYEAMTSKIILSVSNNNAHISSKGGFLEIAEYLFLDNKKEAIIIVDSFKVYTTVPVEEIKTRTIEKLDETIDILGHSCQKYKVTVKDSYNNYETIAWVANDLIVPSSTILEEYGFDLFLKGISKAVLKIESFAGKFEATKITSETPDPSIFKIPKGYKLEKKLFRKVD